MLKVPDLTQLWHSQEKLQEGRLVLSSFFFSSTVENCCIFLLLKIAFLVSYAKTSDAIETMQHNAF